MSEWRDYQDKALIEVPSYYAKGAKGVAVSAPPRSGKTRFFCKIVKDWAAEGRTVAITAHRGFLLEQISNELERQGVRNGMIAASESTDKKALVQVCSIQSMKSRHLPAKPDCFVVDEAHRLKAKSYENFFGKNEDALRLGVSGTWDRLDKQGFRKWMDVMYTMTTTEELLYHPDGPFLKTPIVHEGIDISEDKKRVKVIAGEYSQKENGSLMKRREILGNVLEQYQKYGNGQLAVFYCVDKDHCETLTKEFRAAGIPADYIVDETPKIERFTILNRIKLGLIQAVFCVDILTEGWDEWRVGYVGLLSLTKSHAKLFQSAPRGMTFDENAKKAGLTHCVIMDHAQNFREHGRHILDPRNYTLDGLESVPPKKPRQCPRCEGYLSQSAKECPDPNCDYVVYTEKRQIITKAATFQEQNRENPLITEYRARLRWCKANDKPINDAWLQMLKKHDFDLMLKTFPTYKKGELIRSVFV